MRESTAETNLAAGVFKHKNKNLILSKLQLHITIIKIQLLVNSTVKKTLLWMLLCEEDLDFDFEKADLITSPLVQKDTLL